ncbi:MAG: histidine phosphatase family protein [Bacilli bacterium]
MMIFLIRHGESIQNVEMDNEITEGMPDPDVYLTDKGMEQAYHTGVKLKEYLLENEIDSTNARMWVSPYLRTVQTAKLINESLNIESVFEDPRIVEKDFGNFGSIKKEKWKEIDPITLNTMVRKYESIRGRFFSRFPNGESPFDVYNRISTFIETIFRDDKDPIFIVSHGDTIRCLIMRFLHKDLNWYYDEKTPTNASVIMIYKNKNDKYNYKTVIE